jgi:transcription initiation factor TFIIIB Brf1 subunit/transcription initiation factor TFIIB
MCKIPKCKGRIVSQTLQSGESVCIACGLPISAEHDGWQTVMSRNSETASIKVGAGLLDPNWREYQVKTVKQLLASGMTCNQIQAMFESLRVGVAAYH